MYFGGKVLVISLFIIKKLPTKHQSGSFLLRLTKKNIFLKKIILKKIFYPKFSEKKSILLYIGTHRNVLGTFWTHCPNPVTNWPWKLVRLLAVLDIGFAIGQNVMFFNPNQGGGGPLRPPLTYICESRKSFIIVYYQGLSTFPNYCLRSI